METQEYDALGLGMDLSGVDTSRPCLPETAVVLQIGEVKRTANKSETGFNLVVEFKTVVDMPDATGARIVSAGYPITKYYPLQQSDNPKAPDFRRDLALLQDAVEGPDARKNAAPFAPFNYTGSMVVAKLKIRQDEAYGPSNEISKLDQYVAG